MTDFVGPPPAQRCAPVLCDVCTARNLLKKLNDGTRAYSNVTAKRAWRRWVIDLVVANPRLRPIVFALDHPLPRSEDDPTTTYLVEDLCNEPRLRGRFEPWQFFSPNIDARVVAGP